MPACCLQAALAASGKPAADQAASSAVGGSSSSSSSASSTKPAAGKAEHEPGNEPLSARWDSSSESDYDADGDATMVSEPAFCRLHHFAPASAKSRDASGSASGVSSSAAAASAPPSSPVSTRCIAPSVLICAAVLAHRFASTARTVHSVAWDGRIFRARCALRLRLRLPLTLPCRHAAVLAVAPCLSLCCRTGACGWPACAVG